MLYVLSGKRVLVVVWVTVSRGQIARLITDIDTTLMTSIILIIGGYWFGMCRVVAMGTVACPGRGRSWKLFHGTQCQISPGERAGVRALITASLKNKAHIINSKGFSVSPERQCMFSPLLCRVAKVTANSSRGESLNAIFAITSP